ncbi:MAG: hypothetical protein MJ104_01800 [Lachnospiraceae bacterium]|nr:hypothetical protein [Lachnospiraceae bacterium]
MKSTLQNLLKAVIFTAIFCLGLAGLYEIFRWKDTNGPYVSTFDSLYSQNEDVADVVFAGPSYTYVTMNPAQFWEEYGMAAFNMAISGQDKNSTVASLREVLKTQTPDIVLIDASGTLFDEHEVQSNVYRNTISMKLSANSFKLINASVKPEDRLDFYLRWPIIHTRYKELERYDFIQNPTSIYTAGYMYEWGCYERAASMDVFTVTDSFELSETNKAWIDELVEMSKQHDFELIFYLTPGIGDGDWRRIINGVKDYLDELGITFLDMDKDYIMVGVDFATDFNDYRHMNYFGGVKVTKYVAEYLKAHYDISDHRGEEGYELWETAAMYRKHIVAWNHVSAMQDPVDVAQSVAGIDNLIVVVSLEGNYMDSECNIADTLEAFGIDPQAMQTGGTWVIENGQLTRSFDNTDIYRIKFNNIDTMEISRIISSSGYYLTNVTMDQNYYRNTILNTDGMYLFVYDKVTDKVLCNREF